MTPNEIQLQLTQVSTVNTHVRQLAESGVDSVDSSSLGNDILDHPACLFYTCARLTSENDLFTTPGNVCDLLQSELLTVELKHKNTQPQISQSYSDYNL